MKLKNNIWKFGIYSFIDHFRLVWMITTLYLLGLGFSFTNIGLHETLFALVVILFELPAGAIADLIGKKKAVFISCLLNGIGVTAVGLMKLPMHYYMIALVVGIAFSFISGADVALLYDSVKRLRREKEYKKIRGRINAFNQIASLIGVFVGPALFLINPRLGFIVTGGVYLIASIVILTMVEPYKTHKLTLKKHWKQTITGLKFTIKHRQIMWLFGFFLLTTIGIEFFFDFWQQPLLVNLGFEVKYFGIIFAVMMGIRALVSWFTHRIENKLNEHLSLIVVMFSQVIIFYLLSLKNPYVLIASFAFLYGIMAFGEIIFEDYVNSHIESRRRATVLSVKSFIYSIITVGFYVTLGKFMDIYPISNVLVGISIILLVGGIVLFIFKKGNQKLVL